MPTVDVVRVEPDSLADRLPGTSPRFPSRLAFPPPGRSTSLVQDPPGQVTAFVTRYLPFAEVRGFGDQVLYMCGADGRWCRLAMSKLGFDPVRYTGADTAWSGSVSPDGRWWTFPLRYAEPGANPATGPLAVMDLVTAEVTLHDIGSGRRTAGPVWTADSVLAVDWSAAGEDRRVLLDPASGRTKETRGLPAPMRNLVYAAGGRVFRIERGGRELVEYSEDLHEVSRQKIRFTLTGGRWSTMAVGREGFAFLCPARGAGRDASVIVTDGTLRPVARLEVTGRRLPWTDLFWLDDMTLVLYQGATAQRATPVVGWRVDANATGRLATIEPAGPPPRLLLTELPSGTAG